MPRVIIRASDERVTVIVAGESPERFTFEYPGMLTGAELQEVLAACGIRARYDYQE